jgi:hypothetical protein
MADADALLIRKLIVAALEGGDTHAPRRNEQLATGDELAADDDLSSGEAELSAPLVRCPAGLRNRPG